ncbi:hypothetical protein [Microbulbifer sp. ALW1]|uniref:hypothetical protein n=1 Tax=Microbulbifer sp. (strain ALW1) TaxID=1516059 RepID=UPI00135A1769|nr:hypothetical protein [Microbulbifer sp. ALW1]
MSRIPLVEVPSDEAVVTTLSEVRTQLGFVPAVFRAFANNPTLLTQLWNRYQHVMLTGYLRPQLKEGIALMVAADEHSDYGIRLHSNALEKLGVDPHEVLKIRTDPDHAHYNPKDHALLEVARHGNSTPYDHGDKVLDAARSAGAEDAEIIEALAVAGLASEISHISAILNLPGD